MACDSKDSSQKSRQSEHVSAVLLGRWRLDENKFKVIQVQQSKFKASLKHTVTPCVKRK